MSEGLLKVDFHKISNLLDKKIGPALLNIKIDDYGLLEHIDLTSRQQPLTKTYIFGCMPKSYFELELVEEKTALCAYIKFPLDKMLEMPRVRHVINVIMIEKKQNQITKPIRNIVEVDLNLTFFNALIGKFVIHSLETDLTRNTELVGQMDQYLTIMLDGNIFSTEVKKNSGKSSIWKIKKQFNIKSVSKAQLTIKAFDKDRVSDDLICKNTVNLLKQGLLVPQDRPIFYKINLLHEGKDAGVVILEYTFELLPFNF